MVTTPTQRLSGIQVGRGLASLLVVLFHTELIYSAYFGSSPSAGVFGFGHAGVDFFFVLSGFVLFWVHWDDVGYMERVAAYARKRFRRVYFPYWIVFALVLIGLSLGLGHPRPFDTQIGTIADNLALLPDPRGMTLNVAWTLSYEVMFYILFGLIIANPLIGGTLGAIWLVASISLHGNITFPWSFIFPAYAVHFGMGAGVATYVQRFRVPVPIVLTLCGAAAFVLVGLNEHAISHPWVDWAYAVTSATAIAGLAGADVARMVRWPGLARQLGDASYSVYLVHYPVLSLLMKGLHRVATLLPDWLLFCSAVCLAVAAGTAFHTLIERPLLARYHARQPRAARA